MNTSISAAEYHTMQAAIMTEAQLQACVIAAAGRYGWECYHTHDSRRSRAGYPDLTLWHPQQQRLIFRELKTQKGRTTPEQKHVLETLAAAGADASIWRPIDWFNQTIAGQLDEPQPDITAIAAELGIELLPWQIQYAEAALSGNPVILQRGQQTGRSALERIFRRIASLEQHPPRTTHPTEGEHR